MDYPIEHPDITAIMRTGYPLNCGESPLMPTFREYEGEQATFHKLVTNYRGTWSNHGDKVRYTIDALHSAPTQSKTL